MTLPHSSLPISLPVSLPVSFRGSLPPALHTLRRALRAALLLPLVMSLFATAGSAQAADAASAPAASAPVASTATLESAPPPGTIRVHYRRAKGDTANWGVYSWQGPKNPSKTWIADRFMFDGKDGFGAYVDIALDTAKTEMRFLVSSERGAKNCGNDQSVKLKADIASSGQEIWMLESDCAIHDKAPAL